MKIQPIIVNSLNKNKKALLGAITAMTLTAAPISTLKAQETDSLELKKDYVELVVEQQKDAAKNDIDVEKDARTIASNFAKQLGAALLMVGTAIFCSFDPNKNNNPRS